MKIFSALFSFLDYHYHRLMQHLGFREVWYFPSHHYMMMGDFWDWEYRPDLPPGVYNGEKCPMEKIEEC